MMATNTPLVPTRPGSCFCVFVWDLVLIGYFWALLSNFWGFFFSTSHLNYVQINYFIFILLVKKKKTDYSFCEARNISFGFAIVESPEMKIFNIVQKYVFFLSSTFIMSRVIWTHFKVIWLCYNWMFQSCHFFLIQKNIDIKSEEFLKTNLFLLFLYLLSLVNFMVLGHMPWHLWGKKNPSCIYVNYICISGKNLIDFNILITILPAFSKPTQSYYELKLLHVIPKMDLSLVTINGASASA